MRNWTRVILVVFVLIGSTVSFAFWSLQQFDYAFEKLSEANLAGVSSAYSSLLKQRMESASTSPEVSGELATSTDSVVASTSPETSVTLATSTNPKLSFTFPKSNTEVYIGCTYPISWQSSTTIRSLEGALIDAGTRDTVGPKTSGLAKEIAIEKGSQNLNWKVGSVWPGAYYIKISKINGVDAETRSKVFTIKEMPGDMSATEQKDICKKSI